MINIQMSVIDFTISIILAGIICGLFEFVLKKLKKRKESTTDKGATTTDGLCVYCGHIFTDGSIFEKDLNMGICDCCNTANIKEMVGEEKTQP